MHNDSDKRRKPDRKELSELAGEKNENGNDNFRLISMPNPVITDCSRKDDGGFVYNKDADMMQCKAGELAIKKEIRKHCSEKGKNNAILYSFDVNKCR